MSIIGAQTQDLRTSKYSRLAELFVSPNKVPSKLLSPAINEKSLVFSRFFTNIGSDKNIQCSRSNVPKLIFVIDAIWNIPLGISPEKLLPSIDYLKEVLEIRPFESIWCALWICNKKYIDKTYTRKESWAFQAHFLNHHQKVVWGGYRRDYYFLFKKEMQIISKW